MPLGLTLQMLGVTKVRKALSASGVEYAAAARAALYQCGFVVDAGAAKRVPVDTGRLRSTHYVAPPKRYGGGYRVEVGFGTKYAYRQHQALNYRHTHGEALYLLKALQELAPTFRQRMALLTERNRQLGIGVSSIPAEAPKRPRRGRGRDKRGRFV